MMRLNGPGLGLSSSDRGSIPILMAFIAPALIIWVLGDLKASAPPRSSIAQVATAASGETSVPPRTIKPSQEQLRAEARAAELMRGVPLASPLYYATSSDPQPRGQSPTPEAGPRGEAAPVAPSLTVTSIFRGADGTAAAFVNGKLTRDGDPLADGWTVTVIDAAAKSITIEHPRSQPVNVPLQERVRR